MLEQINCETKVGNSISSLYASALYIIMSYMPPKDVLADINNPKTVQEEKDYDQEVMQLSSFDQMVVPEDLNLVASGTNKVCNKSYTYQDKYYTCDNGVARVSTATIENQKSLVLAFRGTENLLKDGQDYPNFDWHYVLFQPLVDGITQYISKHPDLEQVIITGHSLGGAMVEEFLHTIENATWNNKIRGITFGSAGSREVISNNLVLLNIQHDHDMVPVGSTILADHVHGAILEVDKPDTPFFTPEISAHSKYEYLDTTKQILEKYDVEQTLENYKKACIDNNNVALLDKIIKIGLLDVQGNKILTKDMLEKFIAENPPTQIHLTTAQNLQSVEQNQNQKNLKDLLKEETHITVHSQIVSNMIVDPALSETPLGSSFKSQLNKPLQPVQITQATVNAPNLKLDTTLSSADNASLAPPQKTDTIKILADDINAVPKGTFPKFKAYVSGLKKALLNHTVYEVESGIGDVTGTIENVVDPEKQNPPPANNPATNKSKLGM